MKILTIIISIIFCNTLMWTQNVPEVMVATPEFISGTAISGNFVHISTDGNNTFEHEVLVNDTGRFNYHFEPPLTVGDTIVIWATNKKKESSAKITLEIADSRDAILTLLENYNFYYDPPGLKNATTVRKVTIYNTNFTIPLARFNFLEETGKTNKVGDLLLFNSIGAGVGLSAGELTETRDESGKIIHHEFVNTIGGYFDFQIGVGYELGSTSPEHSPVFLTFSYAIPIYTLKRGGYWVWKKSTPVGPNKGRHGI